VDLIAIRRDHAFSGGKFESGDLFEIILIQIKGGSARWPTVLDLRRLRAVKDHYGARHVALAEWKRGKETSFYTLQMVSGDHRRAWLEVTAAELFGNVT
jgi:hypothetical protein